MSDKYYDFTREEIGPILPRSFGIALEIGCGIGNTLKWLKDSGRCSHTIGIELNAEIAELARLQLDRVFCCDIETSEPDLPEGSVDLMLCLDVLEHLKDPWGVLRRLSRYVRPRGVLVASIPNVRHKSVVLPLVFQRRWEYTDAGHLDRTHLRFFVRETAIGLVEHAGFRVDAVLASRLGKSRRSQRFNRLVPDFIRDFFVKNYLIRGLKPSEPESLQDPDPHGYNVKGGIANTSSPASRSIAS